MPVEYVCSICGGRVLRHTELLDEMLKVYQCTGCGATKEEKVKVWKRIVNMEPENGDTTNTD
jgi:DNA-directed RNA polymerase subunit RPC12/RpoP